MPVSPALAPTDLGETPAGTIHCFQAARTVARRLKFGIANGCTVGSLLLGMTPSSWPSRATSAGRDRTARLRRLRRL
jgi:hypothetical protein